MAMKFQGLPRDQDMVRRTFQKEFEESFGKNANAKAIYLAAPAQFPRFARLFPRPAYLLGHLQVFYRNLGTTLDVFVAEYYDGGISGHRAEPECVQDPFSYFIAGYDYAGVLLRLRNALRVDNRSPKPLEYDIGQEFLDILDNPDRRAIVDELLSADLATELDKRVFHTCEHGFWAVRKAIARKEAIFSSHARYIRNRLEHSEAEVGGATCSQCQQPNIGSSSINSPSPLGGDWSLTPSSSTIPGPNTETKGLLSTTEEAEFEDDPMCQSCCMPDGFSGEHYAGMIQESTHTISM